MNPTELAREVDLPTPTIHRLVTGKSTRPYRSSLEPIANFFSVSMEQLLGEEPLPETDNSPSPPAKQRKILEIPLIKWKELKNYIQDQESTELQETIPVLNDLSPKCFAVLMNDSSMEPQFSKGSILILDPDKEPCDRSYVLVRLGDSKIFIFRQLLIDGDNRFLKPLNPDLSAFNMRLIEDDDKMIAALVEARQVYQPTGLVK